MEDTRRIGRSYGYVIIPQGGLSVAGMQFPEGPRAVGKSPNGGWYRLLTEAGCTIITQDEYEDELQHSASQSLVMPTEETGQEEDENDRTGHDRGDLPATGDSKPKRRASGKRGRAAAVSAGTSAGDDGVPGN